MDALKSWPCKTLLVAGTVLLAAAVVGCGPAVEREPTMTMEEACRPVRPKEDRAVVRVRRALKKPIDVTFDATPLDQALKVIGEKAGVAVIPDPDLAASGVDLPSRHVSLVVNAMPGDEVLDLVLSADLAYVVEGDRVLVTTGGAAQHKMPCVLYPVADLVRSGAPEPQIGYVEQRDIIKQYVNNMSDRSVAAWTDEGGSAAIDYFGGVLIVTQTPRGQERVMDLLNMLRKARAQAGSCEPVRIPETAGAKHIRRRLAERIDVDFENAKLLGVLDFLREALKDVNLVVAPDLDKEGIDLTLRDATLKQKQAPIGEILSLALGPDLGYRVYPHHVLVSTRAKLYADLSMVMYPILDIVEATAGDFPLGKPLGPGVVEDVLAVDWYGVGNILERTVNNGTDPNVAAWTDEGGPAAMDYCDGVLIVTQTPEGQERIIDFLTMLRKAKAQAGSSEPVRMAETAGAKHIRRRLAERIDVDFENAKLLGVLDFLREALKDVNLVVAPDLDKEGIDLTLRDATLKQKQAPIGEILATVLGLDLGYQIRPHYVFISTRYRLRELETVMYPIRDILTETKVDSPVECVPLRSAERVVDVHDTSGVQWDDSSRGAPARAGVGNIFGGREEFRGRGEENELAIGWQEVADIIKRTVSGMTDPKVAAWTDEGGPAAIDYYDGVLIVTQTPQAHERIAEFFALLREGLARVERQLQE